ncbi:hypothetical protein Dimus_014312 [Dionaea muscipula]
MANPGSGNKFVSVNLNKSYGQSSHINSSNSAYGSGRARAGGYGGGGGSGMVVLSRQRNSNKTGPKLSVPPPLNLPSLRKEHERFDPLGSTGGPVGGGGLGSASRPPSSGTGWSKPSGVSMADRERVSSSRPLSSDGADHGLYPEESATKGSGNSAYVPPSSRLGSLGPDIPVLAQAEKTSVLRGEDFPSLRATIAAAANGSLQKQKDVVHQKQRQGDVEEQLGVRGDGAQLRLPTDMHPKVQHHEHSIGSRLGGAAVDSHGSGHSRPLEQGQKQDDYFSGALPLVRLSPRSDWADDERDTGSAFIDRRKDNGFSRTEMYWDEDFDLPRSSILPNKPTQNFSDKWVRRGDDYGKPTFNETPNADLHSRDVRTPSKEGREGNSWRSSVSGVGLSATEFPRDRNVVREKTPTVNQDISQVQKYIPPQFGGNAGEESSNGSAAGKDLFFGRRDAGYAYGGRQQWSNSGGTFNGRGAERNQQDSYGSESSRYKIDHVQNNLVTKSSSSSISKGLTLNDPLLNFGRLKRAFRGGEKPYIEDPFSKDWGSPGFDGRDPLSGGLLGVIKRKKDTSKEVDFHDPVRESFEAELERVQKLQEQERKRIIEEQEKALEMARRQEEERQRLAREQEEHQRRLEEQAREVAWRAEQERFEVIQRTEEQRIAREEEKRRIFMEEERRKQAAKQKLQELEERIAKRQAEAAMAGTSTVVADEKGPEVFKDKDHSRAVDLGSWEDGERLVERITNSSSSDSSTLNKSFDHFRVHSVTDSSLAFTERVKPPSSLRRDTFENRNGSSYFSPDQNDGHHSPRRVVPFGSRAFVPRDFPGGPGNIPSRGLHRGLMSEPHLDDFFHAKGSKWSVSGDGPAYDIAEKFDDVGRGHGHVYGSFNSTHTEQPYQNVEQDELYPYARSRFPSRQPRVLPPPSFASMQRISFRSDSQPVRSLAHEDNTQYSLVQSVSTDPTYNGHHSENQEHLDVVNHDSAIRTEVQRLNSDSAPRCDSQSSLSVSSPPTSPTHLSHDDLDESVDAGLESAPDETIEVSISGNGSLVLNSEAENLATGLSTISLGDDEEWTLENNEELQEQEEYDEDEDGYREEDELHGEDENVDLSKGFEVIHLEEKDPNNVMENMILGFDQGVEVRIPSDDYERNTRNEDIAFVAPQVSVGILQEQESSEGRGDTGHSLQFADISSHSGANSCGGAPEIGKEAEDVAIHSVTFFSSGPPTDILNSGDPSSASVLSASQSVPSSEMNSRPSSQMDMPSAAAVQTQPELPVKLQFGLFSGPSLIPSPVPAIQIGSIQMPLQLHPQASPPLAHILQPHTQMFQFGQIRYPSPISQGTLPLAPHSMSFVQPNVPSHYPLDRRGGDFSVQSHQESPAQIFSKDQSLAHSVNSSQVRQKQTSSEDTVLKEVNLPPGSQSAESEVSLHKGEVSICTTSGIQGRPKANDQTATEVHKKYSTIRNTATFTKGVASESQCQSGPYPESSYGMKNTGIAQGQFAGSNRRKFPFTSRNPGQRSFLPPESLPSDSNGFHRRARRGSHRMEFRVRRSADRRQASTLVPTNSPLLDGASTSCNEKGPALLTKAGLRREKVVEKAEQVVGSETHNLNQLDTQQTGSNVKSSKGPQNEALVRRPDSSHPGDGSLKRNMNPEDDVDAPLQSGVVRIFKQPGIEAPSDEDDFIEVRSKRQMLNDRREQREKEIKAKSSNAKKVLASRRLRSIPQGSVGVRSTSKITTSSSADVPNITHAADTETRSLFSNEVSGRLKNMVSQPLAPIGTPSANSHVQDDSKSQTNKSLQAISLPTSSQAVAPGSLLENKNKVQDGAQTSMVSWGNLRINQQVMPLTQTQLDEAMKPVCFDLPSSVDGSSTKEPNIPTSSILRKDTVFSSVASPINSLLAGEKIQFGAVTSPTILPASMRAVPHGIGPPGPYRPDLKVSNSSISASKNESTHLFEKEKQSTDSCLHLEESVAEVEAAASAVAVATVNSDEVVVSGLDACSISISDSKGFVHADMTGTKTNGIAGDQAAASHSKAEETLSVSLPADLSVETLPFSSWPPLPSPQAASSSQMLSPFPGGAPSHFPFYDINPMIGGPIYAFGPHGESTTSQSQRQKGSPSCSGPLGTWQQCHSGVDSFYGSPAGFTGPFINSSGSIQGVQGPQHMVVYNHFAPVGQFGQVGLGYMSTTYIPSGKQPDWKHNPIPASMGSGDGDLPNLNMASTQRNPPNVPPPPPVHHLAPGSPLLTLPQPLAMFDVSSFQSSSDVPIQGCWTHIPPPPPPLHSVNQSITPLQQQGEGATAARFNQGSADNHTSSANRFPKSHSAPPTETSHSFSAATTDAATGQFPDELGLVDPPTSAAAAVPAAHVAASNSLSGSMVEGAETSDAASPINGSKRVAATAFKNQPGHQRHSSAQQYHHPSSYNYQRNGSGPDWSNRRKMGFHGRNHNNSNGNDKGPFPASKVKQIYVAKQTREGTSTAL